MQRVVQEYLLQPGGTTIIRASQFKPLSVVFASGSIKLIAEVSHDVFGSDYPVVLIGTGCHVIPRSEYIGSVQGHDLFIWHAYLLN